MNMKNAAGTKRAEGLPVLAPAAKTLEIFSEQWRKMQPHHCPVVLRTGDGKSVGACWHYLRDGVCPDHGQIYLSTPGEPAAKRV